MSEFHDLAEVALNAPGASWGNLGYWREESEYSAACCALAHRLAQSLQLSEDSRLVDAGFGCGDQLCLWVSYYRVRSIVGVNFSKSQTRWARSLIAVSGYRERVDLRQGDVDDSRIWRQWQDSFGLANRVVALDCVYHFPSRLRFFECAAGILEVNGRIGVTDFMLADGHERESMAHRILCWMLKRSRIPEDNLVDRKTYVAQLQGAGFQEVLVEDISESVLSGFSVWSKRHFRSTASPAAVMNWHQRMKYVVTGRFLNWAYRKGVLRYCIVTAKRLP